MIAKALRGKSFKGAVAYIAGGLREGAETSRVAWISCHNLPTDDAARAGRMMAWTALHADALKRTWNEENADSPVKLTGRKVERPVYHLILAWAPDEQPDRAAMQSAAREALVALQMEAHEHVVAAHTDGVTQHLHVIANLVHPETGKAASLKNDRLRLQEWALGYERTGGKIHCQQREVNAEARAKGENIIDLASRRRDRELKSARVEGRAGSREANTAFEPPAGDMRLQARFRVAYHGWPTAQHDKAAQVQTPDRSPPPPESQVPRKTNRKAFARAGSAVPVRPDAVTLPDEAAQVKDVQRQRMDALRQQHARAWDHYRAHWKQIYQTERDAL